MAEKKIKSGSEEWLFFQEYYRFRQQFYYADEDDIFYKAMLDAAESISRKYNQDKFVRDLLTAHILDVERRRKGEKTNGKS